MSYRKSGESQGGMQNVTKQSNCIPCVKITTALKEMADFKTREGNMEDEFKIYCSVRK